MPVQLHRAAGRTLDLERADREATPYDLAVWLVALARCAQGELHPPAHAELHTSIAGGQLHRPRDRRPPEVKAAMGKHAARKRAAFREWAAG
jgi:hypothetical protein